MLVILLDSHLKMGRMRVWAAPVHFEIPEEVAEDQNPEKPELIVDYFDFDRA